jgi:hypothetical protein
MLRTNERTGVQTRTFRAADQCGNIATAVQNITVTDAGAPTLVAPRNAQVQCAAAASVREAGAASASDSCDARPVVSHTDAVSAQTCANRLTISRLWVASDACGNSVNATQTLTVFDDTPPRLCLPADVTLTCFANTNVSGMHLVNVPLYGNFVLTKDRNGCGGGCGQLRCRARERDHFQ